ncbi:MAG: ATP-dependent DNA ligase [Nanoarchaeota archaeon]|nr:ATP-dependent DNA ligase [Nanoarchaeota archaeon]MBU1027620.1 ATP-dependent DNA ligase [Nanoarchaeota archaeon]
MRYLKLAQLYKELSSTTKRLKKIEILSKFLEFLSKDDKDVLYLLLGDIYPEYDERKIGISNQLAIKAVSTATGTTKEQLIKDWKKIGDIGKVTEKAIQEKKQSTLGYHILTTEKVLENLRKLPELEGKGTVGKKVALITELLTSASPTEALFLVRTLIGDLRIGLKEATVRDSMAKAFFKDKKESAPKIQKAIDRTNDLAIVFEMVRKGNIKELEKLHLEVGKPIKAMLAQKVANFKEGFKKLGSPCAIEYKYDGFRLIIHKQREKVTLFTRSLENITKQFPEVVNYILDYVKGNSFILDSEAVGFNKKTKEYTDFQAISQRIRRKYHIEKLQKELPIEINVFDILYYNGKSLLNEPFEKRTKIIKKIIKNHPYKIIYAKQIITGDEKTTEKFYKKALEDNQEGIMMKNLKAEYDPGRRVGHMLKIKPEERDLDLVITGAEYGAGKRSGWMSSFILSCKDGKTGKFLEIGKMGTGIKEKSKEEVGGTSFQELTEMLKPLIEKEKGKSVTIKPKIVISVTYQEIQKSPNYNSGWALRFPRFVALRPDKKSSQVSRLKEIEKDFLNQKRNWKYG